MFAALAILLLVHGLIHLLGFLKAFGYARVRQITLPISPLHGWMWLDAGLLLSLSAVLVALKVVWWWMPALLGIITSQYLIVRFWRDANFGTVANVILVVAVTAGIGHWSMTKHFKTDVGHLDRQSGGKVISVDDLAVLPGPVRKYLYYTGVPGKPVVNGFRINFEGKIRKDEESPWMPLTSEQHNSMVPATRLFFMKALMMRLPVTGYHRFVDGTASMDIRLMSMLSVQYMKGPEMDVAETVTFFNDMCVAAPATLMDPRIEWLATEGNRVHARFTNKGISITAWLHFNDEGQLINFVSDDRYAASENQTMKKMRWSTPIGEYREINGYRLAGYAETIYHYPEKDLKYGEFRVKDLEYW